jgi:hypothetical protein
MTTDPIPMSGRQAGGRVAVLAVSSVALTLGFACAPAIAASLAAALLALWSLGGFAGTVESFLAAFIVYEGAIYVTCIASGTGVGSFSAPIDTGFRDQRRVVCRAACGS